MHTDKYIMAAEAVDKIILLDDNIDLNKVLLETVDEILEDEKDRRMLYRYMNALFLNILLNKLDELGIEVEQRALDARKILHNLIKSL